MKKQSKKNIRKIDKRGKRLINLMGSVMEKIKKNHVYKGTFEVGSDSYADEEGVFHLVFEFDFPLGKIK